MYVIDYTTIKNLPLNKVIDKFQQMPGLALNELKVQDLSFDQNNQEIYPGNGVYIYREQTKAKYIGKCSATSFTERMAKHFDLRSVAWMNHLLKNICKKQWKILEPIDQDLLKASRYAFKNFNLILIHFTQDFDEIKKLERVLLRSMGSLNGYKSLYIKDQTQLLTSYY